MIAFGPVPSRRLGRSLGINNIPPKICTYSCIYCQLGSTRCTNARRRMMYDPLQVWREVEQRVQTLSQAGEQITYLTFVPDGEPTLDSNLGKEIDQLISLGIPIAVITNSSLLGDPAVREEIGKADLVSLKVDTVDEQIWQKLNRPHPTLSLDRILSGIQAFADRYQGTLYSETMLIRGVNDEEEQIAPLAQFLASFQPDKAFITIPVRPPAEEWAVPPSEKHIAVAYHMIKDAGLEVECLTGYEGTSFAHTGDVVEDLLGVTAVHPMRKDAVRALIQRAGADWDVVAKLVKQGELIEISYRGHMYYLRKFTGSHRS
jgi:wyosine [tRNA(Phe)-imidazoG37] synthetase (radical SAM superfamily)